MSRGEGWFGLVWFGLVWFGLVWFGLVWFGLVWFGLVWFGLVWFGLITRYIFVVNCILYAGRWTNTLNMLVTAHYNAFYYAACCDSNGGVGSLFFEIIHVIYVGTSCNVAAYTS